MKLHLFRRRILIAGAASMVAAIVPILPLAAKAAALPAGTQAPGFYRVWVGDFEVTALSDGTVAVPLDTLLNGVDKAEIATLMQRNFETLPAEVSINARPVERFINAP